MIFFFQAEDGIRDVAVTGVQTCALPIYIRSRCQATLHRIEKVQDEDMAICDAVQRGLASRAYVAGRLSVRREAGEHLFHRLLHADLTNALARPAAAD